MDIEKNDVTPYHTILLVEDDVRLSALISEYLENNALKVETQFRGDEAVTDIITMQPDLVVLLPQRRQSPGPRIPRHCAGSHGLRPFGQAGSPAL